LKKLCKAMALILAFTLVFSLAGCSSKKPITVDEFEDIMKDEKFNTYRMEHEYLVDDNKYHNGEGCQANMSDPETFINFDIYASEDDAKDFSIKSVELMKKIIKDEESDAKITTKSSGDYEKITIKGELSDDSDIYRVIIRIENTVLDATILSDSKSDVKLIDGIVKKLGY